MILVHGHQFYTRISFSVHFFFYKALVFVVPIFTFEVFVLFSSQARPCRELAQTLVHDSRSTSNFVPCRVPISVSAHNAVLLALIHPFNLATDAV